MDRWTINCLSRSTPRIFFSLHFCILSVTIDGPTSQSVVGLMVRRCLCSSIVISSCRVLGVLSVTINSLPRRSVDQLTDHRSFCSPTLSQNSLILFQQLEPPVDDHHYGPSIGRRAVDGSVGHHFALISTHFSAFAFWTVFL